MYWKHAHTCSMHIHTHTHAHTHAHTRTRTHAHAHTHTHIIILIHITASVRGTGRDPNKSIVLPTNPKPHVWTLAWNGIKHVTRQAWDGVSVFVMNICISINTIYTHKYRTCTSMQHSSSVCYPHKFSMHTQYGNEFYIYSTWEYILL